MATLSAPGYSRLGIISGWMLAGLYLTHAVLTTTLARTDRVLPLREELRGWHYVVGTLLFLTALVRLWAWAKERPSPPEGLPASAFTWGRALALAALFLMVSAPLVGLLYAWADGLEVRLGSLTLPALVGRDRALWQAAGYFHSGLGFMLVVLNLATLLTAAFTSVRFRHGLLTGFPPGHGAFAFLGFSSTVYAFATFRSPDPGPMAVAIFWSVAAAWALFAWAIHRNRAPVPRSRNATPVARGLAGVGAVALLLFGAWGPYGMFRVTPFSAAAEVDVVDGIEWHARPALASLDIAPADAFEAGVEAETFKWCRFCHNMQPGGEQHKVGPNLHNIMGQRAGTVPGFGYSPAMRRARDEGLVWTDETMAAYIADPQGWMPGTSMIISSGPIPDPRVQAAVVNILKRETAPRDPAG
ncbi:MAG: c-type cytochrome, partial [Thermaurantiacus sp.]